MDSYSHIGWSSVGYYMSSRSQQTTKLQQYVNIFYRIFEMGTLELFYALLYHITALWNSG